MIQRLAIDRLHILGDVYDRGQGAHLIMETLSGYRDYDIQWGNHDALWMGAAAGNEVCIANVLRISLRYDNMATLEDGYGINLVPLASFAMEVYGDDPCTVFLPKIPEAETALAEKNRLLTARMHKAISVIQWKLEAALIDRYPQWKMEDRKLLEHIDQEKGTVTIDGIEYPLKDSRFPTVNPADPYRLTEEEEELTRKLVHSFKVSDNLRRHIGIFLNHGGMYKVMNSNLMFHASVPLNEDGSLREVSIPGGTPQKGKALLDGVDRIMRMAFNSDAAPKLRRLSTDYYYYWWCGPESPLFDKKKMATFERYLIDDKTVRAEPKGWYYKLRNEAEVCDRILDDFGVEGDHRHIINGHVPVKAADGESPIKANGKLMVIDGGFSKAYHDTTGIAGYTLVYHSRGFELVQHDPFTSADDAVHRGSDIVSTTSIVELNSNRVNVRDTDIGRQLQFQIDELKALLRAYRRGELPTH